jgi:hypothetical protein
MNAHALAVYPGIGWRTQAEAQGFDDKFRMLRIRRSWFFVRRLRVGSPYCPRQCDDLLVSVGAVIDFPPTSMQKTEPAQPDNFILGEIQVILSEKRTALSSLRTGIAVFALPLSVLSVLVATSRNYTFARVMPLLAPLLVLSLALVVLGCWLVFRSIWHLRRHDRRIDALKQKYASLSEFVE